jgi:hypothetical protein
MADEDTLKTPPWDCSLGRAVELQRLRQGRGRTLFGIRGELNGEKKELHFF